MKKTTKFISLLLALMLTVSCFAGIAVFPASAAGEQKVYFQFPEDGTWGDPANSVNAKGASQVYFECYAIYGNQTELKHNSWQGRASTCTIEGNNVFSYDLSKLGTIEEGADYGILFSTKANGGYQTCDITMTSDCIGDTVYVTPYEGVATRENTQDSKKVDYYAAWTNNTQCGPKASISSLGVLMPGLFPFYQPKAQQLSNCLTGYLTNPVNNAYFQYDNNMAICEGLGVTPQEVYDQYVADNAAIIEAAGGEVQTSADIPCPFITDGTTKIAAPEYVKEVLGIQDEEPTTEEPTEPPYVDVTDPATGVTVNINNPNAVLTVDALTEGSDYNTAVTALAAEGKQVVSLYDINLTDNGAEYQPAELVTVKIPSETAEGSVYRIETDGTLTDMNAVYAEGAYEFTAEHFSLYAVADELSVPEGVYSIIGSNEDVFGGVWWVDYTGTEMTYDPVDGLFKITFADVEAQKMLQLKVIKDHDGDQCWPSTGGNYTFDVNSAGDLTVTFNPETGDINVIGDITIVDSIDIYSVIAVGNGEDTYLNGANWDPCDTSNAMTEVADGIWEITMEDIYAFDNYQIKFAANSVDENDNPVSNPWGTNWGTETEALYPTGEPINATFNGKNCIFEVEEDESVVKIQLDLRNFDYSTKEGAVFTITVTPPEPVHEHTAGAPVQENVVAADCENGGSYDEVVYCTECGEELSRNHVDTPALGHVPGETVYEVVTTADCEHGGSVDEVVYCTRCGEEISRNNVPTPALGHHTEYVAEVPATETSEGVKAHYKCSQCGKLFSDAAAENEVTAASLVIPKLEPATEAPTTEEPTEAPTTEAPTEAPTTEAPTEAPTTEPIDVETLTVNAVSNVFSTGTKTYNTADGIPETVLITFYADLSTVKLQAAQFAITYDPSVLTFDPAKNGDYDADEDEYDYSYKAFPVTNGTGQVNYIQPGKIKFAIANEAGLKLRQSGTPIPIAQIIFDVAEGATGVTDVTMDCGVVSFVNTKTDDEYIVYSTAGGLNQESLDYINSLGGEYGALFALIDHVEVVDAGYDATCTETGLTDGAHCAICGEVLVAQEVIPAKGHTVVVDEAVPADCTHTGLTEGSHCSVCNEVLVAQQVVPATGHTIVTDAAVPATCTETGLTAGSHCSVCGEVFTAQQVIPASGHTVVVDAAVPATCTETGLTQGSHCSVCNEVLVAQQVVPATGHTPVIDPEVPADCTHVGRTQGSHCSVCGEVLVKQSIIPAKGHTAVVDEAVESDCTHTGLTEGSHCSVCNEVLVAQQVVPAKGHTIVTDAAVPATCTETGLTAGSHCSVCNEIIVAQQVVPALGHDEVTVPGYPATYTSTGLTDGVYCNRCNEWIVPQVVIPKLTPAYLIGDVNRDGNVDVLDAVLIQKYSVDKVTLDEEQLYIGDVNDDGIVDILDAIQIQKFAVDKITEFQKKA